MYKIPGQYSLQSVNDRQNKNKLKKKSTSTADPVAFEASAELRESRALTSMMQ